MNKIAAKAHAERLAAERLLEAFACAPQSKHRATTKVAKRVLINGPYIFQGRLYDVKLKALGVGIHELRLEPITKEGD